MGALSLPFSSQNFLPITSVSSDFFPWNPRLFEVSRNHKNNSKTRNISFPVSCSSVKTVRSPSLDRHVVKQNKIRFVLKLQTLLLSKPRCYIPLQILNKCRSYLSLSKPRSILSMIHRYPTIFEVFSIPTAPMPFNASKSLSQPCVRLTPAAAALAAQESTLKSANSDSLATKLQKLLMLSSHHRLVLSKLVHLGPDLGLHPNFRSRLCNDHPEKFKTIDTSYGRALELVSWDQDLAKPLPPPQVQSRGLIVDRPLKFKHLNLRKGLNLKRRHQEFLMRFREIPDVCPYNTPASEFPKESIEAEKRACLVVREMLGMMVEKRTLIDHLTHFRKEFGLPNKLRGMIVRHPELFYVSLKGQRDSVFLVEGYDENGSLLDKKKETLVIKEKLMELVRESKRLRKERRKARLNNTRIDDCNGDNSDDDDDDYYDDGFLDLFESEDLYLDDIGDDKSETLNYRQNGEFWTADAYSDVEGRDGQHLEPW
ncbi:putative plant organelle RNA recognition domain-containing protein [Rosa chinensis]|uniref:Putative plant organelle RNA recognition domain-containing protein n=1 Tax=Rosa chinensis TaxID=74649 RepID=A0A2P6QVG8_ROSCH|nr:protein WHAT'S THIS FACTOR 1 homolog, chloroplastic [Rosa chinensis]PRQ38154.1 putative plant organelle RNA recognition domain-containing protein [Rosa chinensis]